MLTKTDQIIIHSSGILITGGAYDRSAEVFIPSSKSECRLRSFPSTRRDHTQSGLTACGGHRHASLNTCLGTGHILVTAAKLFIKGTG